VNEPTAAEKHAKIARAVWPDALKKEHGGFIFVWHGTEPNRERRMFNLLVTDPDGTPTTQAKADKDDCLTWLAENRFRAFAYLMRDGMPTQQHVFDALWEVVG